MLSVIGLSGSPSKPSKTRLLIEAVVTRISVEAHAQNHIIDIAELLPHLAISSREGAPAPVEEALQLIEKADLLIVGSPVYKGSYTGLFKHLIDLVDYRALQGKPVGLLATGGSERHALVIEHQLRPLFAFFGAKTLGTGVFVTERTIASGWLADDAIKGRLDLLIAEAVQELRPRTQRRQMLVG